MNNCAISHNITVEKLCLYHYNKEVICRSNKKDGDDKMSKKLKWLLIILSVVLLLLFGAVFGLLGYWKPWQEAASTMPQSGQMLLTQQPEGELILSWPKGEGQDRYRLRILRGQEVLLEEWVWEASYVLPELPREDTLDILITTADGYRYPFEKEERIRMGVGELNAQVQLQMPAIGAVAYTPDPETQTARFQFDLEDNSVCRMYRLGTEETMTQLHTLEQGDVTVSFGDGQDFPSLSRNETMTFAFDCYRFSPNLVYYGTVTEEVTVCGEDLLGRDLALSCTELGNNVYAFSWQNTKGDYYEVQQLDAASESWKVLTRVELDEERSYTTSHLSRYSDFRYRVVAVGGQTMPDSEYAAISEEITVTTGTTAVFTTVWPLQELDFYADLEMTEVIGKAEAAKALCVLDEVDGIFRVRIDGQEGYIDSRYCLINLPEYLGDICLYDIPNSYASLYMAHEYELPTVTGEVIVGYERVKMKNGEQLVPLLYPVAKRLEQAAFAAMEQGYKLKIYDAYRPREATIALYDQAIGLKDQPIPLETYTGKVLEDLPVLEEGQILTYGNLMTDFDRYTMNYFLAAGKSRHNRGIALDLTLADMKTGKDLKMQTSMHDLSWYSENARDNGNARKLSSIMESVGFTGLKSEWWHFNDLEVQDSLQPEHQMKGVTPECWMADDQGWRYRRKNGEFYVNCTETINGTEYTFDEQGYVVD